MPGKRKRNFVHNNIEDVQVKGKRHTLDSDEEDSEDYEKDNFFEREIDGEEEGVSKIHDDIKITPFNMQEELEEGHFDKDGHYHWNKTNNIQDNWLDNIDWVKIQKEKDKLNMHENTPSVIDSVDIHHESVLYKQLLSYMIKGETVAGSLRRFGENRLKMSSIERLRLKQHGVINDNAEKIIQFTEVVNEILIKTGNMDIYQATYESIEEKINGTPCTSKECGVSSDTRLGIYSDDRNKRQKLHKEKSSSEVIKGEPKLNEVLWEFKWKQQDENAQGPFNTNQMVKWTTNGYFKDGVYVRKVGELTNFYRSNRIDFDLYL